MVSPFIPLFGASPNVLVGRQRVLEDVLAAFGGEFDPYRSTWLCAPSGTGKTVLLNEIQKLAEQAGWEVVQEDAVPTGVSQRVAARLHRQSARQGRQSNGDAVEQLGLRKQVIEVLTGNNPPAGVLITVDEVDRADRAELADYVNVIQQLLREDYPVASVVAGRPVAESDDLTTILAQYAKPRLETLATPAVALGLQHTARVDGGGLSADALELATAVTGGFPFMMQLVGYWSWRETNDGKIDVSAVERALPRCQHELVGALPDFGSVRKSDTMYRYLLAMSVDDGPSRTEEVARRLDLSAEQVSADRARLIDAGVIVPVGPDEVDLVEPGHRPVLRLDEFFRRSRAGADASG